MVVQGSHPRTDLLEGRDKDGAQEAARSMQTASHEPRTASSLSGAKFITSCSRLRGDIERGTAADGLEGDERSPSEMMKRTLTTQDHRPRDLLSRPAPSLSRRQARNGKAI